MGNLWQIAVVVVLAAVLLPAANIAYSEGATTTDENETLTVQHGASSTVSVDAPVYSDDATITSGGEELVEDEDYRWDAAFGSVYWPEGSGADDGTQAEIEYSWSESSETTDGVASIIGSVGWLVWLLVFLTVMGTLLAWLGLGTGGDW